MLAKKFKATSVFKDGDTSALVIEYPKSPVTSSGLQILKYNEGLKVNTAVFRNCHFLVNPKDNKENMANANGSHVVSAESDLYVVIAFPFGSSLKTGTGFSIITTLPKGLIMKGERTVAGSNVYFFEGLNLALFDQAPSIN